MSSHSWKSAEITRIIDGLSVPAFVIDKNHLILHWNTAMETLSGMSRDQLLNTVHSWQAFYKEKRPTLADMIVDELPFHEINRLYPENCTQSSIIEGTVEADTCIQDSTGNAKWLHITASTLKDDRGRVCGAIETLEDISEWKSVEDALSESEKSYRALFESAYDAIWVHDMHGNIHTANEALAVLCGYSVQEMIGMNVKDFIIGENDIQVARDVKKILLDGGRIDAPYEMTLKRKDRSKLITMVTTNLVNIGIDSKAFQNTARDVTHEKQMEENLRYYLQQITRAQEEERKRIARELHDDTAQRMLSLSRQIDNFIRNQSEINDSFLSFLKNLRGQIGEGVEAVHRYAQDLRPSLIDDLGLIAALRSYAKRAREYDDMVISLRVKGQERRLPSEVEMLLYRVIQEALNNVWKHAEATMIQIDVIFEEKRVVVCVTDNGKGFNISETVSSVPHTGKLGIIGMQERAKLLGGVLKFESSPGKGTRVRFTMPV